MAGPAKSITNIPRGVSAQDAGPLHTTMRSFRNATAKALDGKLNVVGQVSLDVSPATTTDIDDPRIIPTTQCFLTALDANAAAEVAGGTIHSAVVSGSTTIRITHSASAGARTFGYALLG